MAGQPNPPARTVNDYPYGCTCQRAPNDGSNTACDLDCPIGTKVITPVPATIPLAAWVKEILTVTRHLVHQHTAGGGSDPWRFTAEETDAVDRITGVRLLGRTITGRGSDCLTWGRLWQPHGLTPAERGPLCRAVREALRAAWRVEGVLMEEEAGPVGTATLPPTRGAMADHATST